MDSEGKVKGLHLVGCYGHLGGRIDPVALQHPAHDVMVSELTRVFFFFLSSVRNHLGR